MKLPLRAAPPPPSSHYQSHSTSWKDDLFSDDPFAAPMEKKKPPPRPPPPKFNRAALSKPDIPSRPAHFNRKPTILSNLMARKPKPATPNGDFQSHMIPPPVKSNNFSSTAVASLIDLSSPPSSPTLTTRSSSDGLSVDSFGSDITTSTANGNSNFNGGNSSQAESGFEDDFDLFSNRTPNNEGDNWGGFDPFSPPKPAQKPAVTRPVYDSDFLDPLCNGKTVVPKVQTHKIPTIIRPKPARPKAPRNSALLSSTLNSIQPPAYSPKPAPRYTLQSQLQSTYQAPEDIFESGEYSPPMPTMPPPPPPTLDVTDFFANDTPSGDWLNPIMTEDFEVDEEPYGIALYDFPGSHNDDLPFKANDKIRLLRQLNDEWLYGRARSGMEGMFPANFVDIKVPLKTEVVEEIVHYVTAMFDFVPQQEGDLGFAVGSKIKVLAKMNEEWLYGELSSNQGQFPANYVDHIPDGLPTRPA
ncbi:uncharacterized protein LOC143917114 isoform X3 [Arctopsyche grandis]